MHHVLKIQHISLLPNYIQQISRVDFLRVCACTYANGHQKVKPVHKTGLFHQPSHKQKKL